MRNDERPLLILDLDETLIHATGRVLDRHPDFQLGSYFVYRRPAVDAFLASCAERYRLAVWSSGGSEYVAGLVENLFTGRPAPLFAWSRDAAANGCGNARRSVFKGSAEGQALGL